MIFVPSGNPYCVYLHMSGDNVFYVGKGRAYRPFERDDRNEAWLRCATSGYTVVIHSWHATDKSAREVEHSLIAALKPKCNVAFPGYRRPGTGVKWEDRPQEWKEKTLRKLRLPRGEQWKQNISKALKGRVASVESRLKMSQSAKRRIANGQRNGVDLRAVECLDTGEVFRSVSEAARAFGLTTSSICAVARGKKKNAGGKKFAYLVDAGNNR